MDSELLRNPALAIARSVGHNMKMTDKISNILFYIGIALLLVGAFGLTFAAFFAFIGLPVFAVGLVLILITRKPWKHKLITIGIFIGSILIFWPIWTQINSVGPEIFLIPEDYRGRVNIIFKEGCGQEITRTEEGLIYSIPDNGILILNAEQKFGIIEHTYYLVDKNGNRTELPKMDVRDFNEKWTTEKNPDEPPRDKLGVFHWGRTGSQGKNIDEEGNVTNENELHTFSEFYVSTYNDLTERFDFKYERQFDSLRDEEFEKCK